jgi:transposase
MKRELTQILNLPGVIVKSKKEIEKTLILDVEASSNTGCCPGCQKVSNRLHRLDALPIAPYNGAGSHRKTIGI